ncbi:hypothetical protein ACOSP7_009092 [Xanthoceras sorbifolium]
MEALIQHIHEMSAPIKKSSINSVTDSPFVDAIELVKMPRKFSFPNIKHYDGTTDPDDHIAQHRQRMFMVAIPTNLMEAGLLHDSDFYKALTKYPYKTMKDVFAKAWAQIKWKEDEVNYTPSRHNRNDERCSRRVERKSTEHKSEPYPMTQRNDIACENRAPGDRPPQQPKRIRVRVPEYNLSITLAEAVAAIKNLGNAVKWLGRMSSHADKRDSTKWCDFHGNHGYKTEDCIAHKFEVVKLLKRGHLKEHLTNKGKKTLAPKDERQVEQSTPPMIPCDTRES